MEMAGRGRPDASDRGTDRPDEDEADKKWPRHETKEFHMLVEMIDTLLSLFASRWTGPIAVVGVWRQPRRPDRARIECQAQ
jgi:hypothetical protein